MTDEPRVLTRLTEVIHGLDATLTEIRAVITDLHLVAVVPPLQIAQERNGCAHDAIERFV
jgi:hypothetical protein